MPGASQSTYGVNLSTGHVSFPLTLVQADGQNGLDIDVQIVYTSAIEQQAQTWNQDRPLDILGMGWSLSQTAIIRDTHGTGSLLDDTFYLIADGASKLLQIGQDATNIYYAAENYQFWRIFYTPAAEQWTIVQEDGTMFLLGGGVTIDAPGNRQSLGNSIEWGVKWGNWIGSSRQVSGQSQFALVWNLATVIGPYNQILNLAYIQTQKPVGGPGGLHYTQASYLSMISASTSHSVTFLYENKDADEYPTSLSAPNQADPYQQRLQTQYLSVLHIQNQSGTLLYTVNLSYAFLNTGKMKKRVLTSVARLSPSGRLYEPPLHFTYYGQSNEDGVSVTLSDNSKLYNSSTQALYGALKSMTASIGETTTYKYSRIQLTTTQRSQKQISAPDGTWSQPHLYFGSDFTLVIWNKSNQVYLSVYQWRGTWVTYNAGSLPSGGGPPKVLMSDSFFVVITSGQTQSVHFFHKDPLRFGQWLHTPQTVRLSASTQGTVGESFIALLDGIQLYRYTWNETSTSWTPPTSDGGNPLSLPFTQPGAKHAIAGTHRYFLVVSTPSRTLDSHSKPEVRLYFVDANGNWQHKTQTIDWFLPDPSTIPDVDSVSGGSAYQLLLYASNTFVGLKSYGIYIYTRGENVYTQYNSAYLVFQWNEDFAQTSNITYQTLFTNQTSQESVVKDETLTAIGNVLGIVSQQKKMLYRFDGQRWNSRVLSLADPANFYGADTALEVSRNVGTKRTSLQQYNPSNNSWEAQFSFDSIDIHFYQTLLDILDFLVISIATAPFGFLEGYLLSTILEGLRANGSLANGFGSADITGFRYMTITRSLYSQNGDRSWTQLTNDLLNNTPNLKLVYDLLTLSEHFIAFMTTHEEHIPQIGRDEFRYKNFRNWIWLLRNGQVVKMLTLETTAEQQNNEASLTTEPSAEQNWLVSSNTLVAYPRQHGSPCGDNYDPSSPPCASNFKDTSSFNLYRVINDDSTGSLSSYAVGQVSSFDGYQTVNTFLEYEVTNSVVDPITATPVYNKVTASSGITLQQAKQRGWNEFYFYNGSTQPLPYAPSDPAFTNANIYPALVAGQLYSSRAYAAPPDLLLLTSPRDEEQHAIVAEGDISPALSVTPIPFTLVMEQTTFWYVFQKTQPTGQASYTVRPLKTLETLDGAQKRQEYAYDVPTNPRDTTFHSGVLTSEKNWSYSASGQENLTQINYLYTWQVYAELLGKNNLTQVAQTTTMHYEPSTTTTPSVESVFATTWQFWPDTVWAPRATYQWSGAGQPNFSAWYEENGPGSNWLPITENVSVAGGIPLETLDANGTATSFIYDRNYHFLIGQFVNASHSHFEAWYSAFEAYEDLSAWQVNGHLIDAYLTTQDSYVGTSCLTLSSNTKATLYGASNSPSLSTPLLEHSFVLSAYLKTGAGFATDNGIASLGLVVFNKNLGVRKVVTSPLPDTNQRWQLCEIVVDLGQIHIQNNWGTSDILSLGIEITNTKATSSLLVDAVRLSPLDALLSLYVYDASYRMLTATLDANGLALRTAYDALQCEIGSCGPGDQVRRITVPYLSRMGNQQGFQSADPNTILNLASRSGGTYYGFRGGNTNGWSGGIIINDRLILKGDETAELTGINGHCGVRLQLDTHFSSLTLKWKASVPNELGQLFTRIAIAANGTVYAGTVRGWLVALSASNHSVPAWRLQLEIVTDQFAHSMHCLVGPDQTIYATVEDRIHAVTPDARQKWTYSNPQNRELSPPVFGQGGLLYASDDLALHAINPANGSEVWMYRYPQNVKNPGAASVALGPDGTLYAGLGSPENAQFSSQPGLLYAISPTGQAKWTRPFTTDGDILQAPGISSNNMIYVTTVTRKIYAIRPDGTPAWSQPTRLDAYIASMTPVIGRRGIIYLAGGANVYALNLDGSLKWQQVIDSTVGSQLAIDEDDTCYVTFDDGNTSGLVTFRADGTPWTAPFSVSDFEEGQIAAGPVIGSDGMLYASSRAAQNIYALQASGKTVENGLSVSLGNVRVTYQGGAYTLSENNNPINAPVTAPLASDWLLLAFEHTILFYADGRQLLATTALNQAVSGSLQLASHGDDNSGVAFHDIFVFQDPVSITSYLDGAGQLRQQQMRESPSSVIISEILYDEQGQAAFGTVPVRKQQGAAHPSLFGFEPAFVDGRDPASGNALWDRSLTNPRHGVMSGLIQQWLDPQFKTDYPYVGNISENSPLKRPILETAPDRNFIYGAGHTLQYSYGLSSAAQSFLQRLNIPQDKQTNYLVAARSLPLNDTTRLPSISVRNTQGQRILTGAQDQQYIRLFSTSDSFQPVSQRPDIGFSHTLYYPNYYTFGPAGTAFKVLEQYNRRDLLVQQTTTDAQTGTSYIYDKTGRLRFLLDADGAAEHPQRILYAKYDHLERLIETGMLSMNWNQQVLEEYARTLPNWPPMGTPLKQYLYDRGLDGQSSNAKGRPVQIITASGLQESGMTSTTTTLTYDSAGNITSYSTLVSGYDTRVHVTTYTYDASNNVTSITYPVPTTDQTALTVTYTYNPLGRIASIGKPGNPDAFGSYSYNPDGTIGQESLNAQTNNQANTLRTYTYNSLGWLTSISDPRFMTEQLSYQDEQGMYLSGDITSTRFTFQSSVQVASKRAASYSYNYKYDAFHQFVQAQHSSDPTLNLTIGQLENGRVVNGYDANGNILLWQQGNQTRSYHYTAGTNQVSSVTGGQAAQNFTYTPGGAVKTTPALANIGYDPLLCRSLIALKADGQTQVLSLYGSNSERALKMVQHKDQQGNWQTSQKTLSLYGTGALPLLEASTTSDNQLQQMQYIYGPTGLLAMSDGTTEYFVLKDHLDSTRVIFNAANEVVAFFNYTPFGELLEGNSTVDGTTQRFSHRYTGQQYDFELDLYNYRARFYDSTLGRFYAPDPAHQFSSPYAYVGNNPLNRTDPTGAVWVPSGRAIARLATTAGGLLAAGVYQLLLRSGSGRLIATAASAATFISGLSLGRYLIRLRARSLSAAANPFGDVGNANHPLIIYTKGDIKMKLNAFLLANWRGIDPNNVVEYGSGLEFRRYNRHIITLMHGSYEPTSPVRNGRRIFVEGGAANNTSTVILDGRELGEGLDAMDVFSLDPNAQWFIENLSCYGGRPFAVSHRLEAFLRRRGLNVVVKGGQNPLTIYSLGVLLPIAGSTGTRLTIDNWPRLEEFLNKAGITDQWSFNYYPPQRTPSLLATIFMDKPI